MPSAVTSRPRSRHNWMVAETMALQRAVVSISAIRLRSSFTRVMGRRSSEASDE